MLPIIDQFFAFSEQVRPYLTLLILLIVVVALLYNAIANRGMPRIGGKIGRRTPDAPAPPLPEGFTRVDCREITNFVAADDAEPYESLKAFVREAVAHRPGLVHVYRVAGLRTRIEIPAGPPNYQRIDAAETLALLRELPDPRLVYRLHLSDELSVLDPWMRKVIGRDFYSIGHATPDDLVVLYRPDRYLGRELGLTLLHEWLHLVAFKSARAIRRFKRANKIEPLPALPYQPLTSGDARTPIFEAWCVLGEKVLGYDETVARQAALAAPVHSMILWRHIAKILRKVPKRFTSTRLDEFKARAAFMRLEVAPKARAVRRQHRWWRRSRSKPPL
jgi:hypothetical protein